MNYMIFDGAANLVESFDEEHEARHALEEIARQDPESADEYAMLAFDDDGHPVGEALSGADLHVTA